MVPGSLLAGCVIALAATSLVYVDARQRPLATRSRRRWTGCAALVSFGGLLTAYAVDGLLYRASVGGSAVRVAPTPRALTAGLLVVALATGAAAVLGYGIGSRFGPLAAGSK